jgi:hypothetical protein
LIVSPNGGCSVSETIAPTEADDNAYAGMRSVDEDYRLKDIRLIDVVDEHPDRVRHQIVTVFPNLVLQKTQNAMAIRFFTPNAVDRTHLEWTYFGYADDTPEIRKRRLRHLNLGGPAGFVSMEDGCVGGFVERGIATAEAESAIGLCRDDRYRQVGIVARFLCRRLPLQDHVGREPQARPQRRCRLCRFPRNAAGPRHRAANGKYL